MPKFLKRLALFFFSFFMLIGISSCGFFNTGNEGIMIDSITSVLEEDGSTTITIYFTDEDTDPISFTIPAGSQGEQGETGATGVGIDHIDTVEDEENRVLIITIYFTDEDMDPEVIEVPLGTTITGIESSYDATTGITTITITLSDGTTETFEVTNGTDAVGIVDITTYVDEGGNTTITIYLSDGSTKEIYIPYVSGYDGEPGEDGEDGEDGVGISYIETTYTDDQCIITIYLTDGTSYDVEIDLPVAGTTWYTGNGAPTIIDYPDAKSGDLYYDLTRNRIYIYDGSSWSVLFRLNQDDIECTVYFNATANGGAIDGSTSPYYYCTKGETIPLSSIPTASKEGYTFKGWYTSTQGPNDPNSGHFTDLTPVLVEYLTLYAYFEAN